MSIYEEENQLFNEWKEKRKGFVPDGVVSEDDYLKSNPKIVIILKEVNDPGGGSWDLRGYLRNGAEGGGPTWNNITRWVYGIQNRKKRINWMKDVESIDGECRKKVLKSICAINLKKSPGGSSADDNLLWNIAKEDKCFIKRQYGFYDPDMTVCCGKGIESLFKDEVVGHKNREWQQTSRGVWWYERDPGKYVIAINHPQQYSVRPSLLFYELFDAVNEIYNP